jgi:hypothetical protein
VDANEEEDDETAISESARASMSQASSYSRAFEAYAFDPEVDSVVDYSGGDPNGPLYRWSRPDLARM